jgi:hypothetical protein
MFVAHGGESWTGKEYMLYGLEGLAALAGNLFLGVLWEEVSRVLSPGPKA